MKLFQFLVILFDRLEQRATSPLYRAAYRRLYLDALRAVWEVEREEKRKTLTTGV
jgi:hypothetical protein